MHIYYMNIHLQERLMNFILFKHEEETNPIKHNERGKLAPTVLLITQKYSRDSVEVFQSFLQHVH